MDRRKGTAVLCVVPGGKPGTSIARESEENARPRVEHHYPASDQAMS